MSPEEIAVWQAAERSVQQAPDLVRGDDVAMHLETAWLRPFRNGPEQ